MERANHACDHDYYNRQQVTLLEGRDKCYIKVDKVHKFRWGVSEKTEFYFRF